MSLAAVESALVAAVENALRGAVQVKCRVYRGWPVSDALEKFTQAGGCDISVYSRPGMSRNTTRYPVAWQQLSSVAPTLTITTDGNTITLAGASGTAQNVGAVIAGERYVYAAGPTDNAVTAAAGLAALIPDAAVAGAVITVPGVQQVAVGAFGTVSSEVRREWQELSVIIWAPTPDVRDAVSGVLDLALAQLPWLQLPDGTTARLLYRGQRTDDLPQKAALWRRDMNYGVEFGVSAQAQAAEALFSPAVSVSAV
ncbi:hypothetical protein FHR90_003248 [Endobacter medicaginis]|uniref:Uncharacterized protein n=1 Tax=Endobacter medicaginis TaxID=1181271 RepID=A0A850NHK2_9PROT|nr:hypothetical protein [Endobacter medicaginis]MBB3175393.1 hypothetical protein [Endobacter medicaginis]MCX5476735.1 hypothetical protein [Endobacter medicaginis]NVN29341.1 hypothetical protein [Endobacter medicaginis]